MTGQTQASGQNLTGIWHGLYSYPSNRKPVSFVATLIETASAVSGTTHEPTTFGGDPNDILYATLMGSRHNSTVVFVKIYETKNPRYHRVDYEGTLSSDGTEIDGRWVITGVWSGKFLMVRSAGSVESTARKIYQRA